METFVGDTFSWLIYAIYRYQNNLVHSNHQKLKNGHWESHSLFGTAPYLAWILCFLLRLVMRPSSGVLHFPSDHLSFYYIYRSTTYFNRWGYRWHHIYGVSKSPQFKKNVRPRARDAIAGKARRRRHHGTIHGSLLLHWLTWCIEILLVGQCNLMVTLSNGQLWRCNGTLDRVNLCPTTMVITNVVSEWFKWARTACPSQTDSNLLNVPLQVPNTISQCFKAKFISLHSQHLTIIASKWSTLTPFPERFTASVWYHPQALHQCDIIGVAPVWYQPPLSSRYGGGGKKTQVPGDVSCQSLLKVNTIMSKFHNLKKKSKSDIGDIYFYKWHQR